MSWDDTHFPSKEKVTKFMFKVNKVFHSINALFVKLNVIIFQLNETILYIYLHQIYRVPSLPNAIDAILHFLRVR